MARDHPFRGAIFRIGTIGILRVGVLGRLSVHRVRHGLGIPDVQCPSHVAKAYTVRILPSQQGSLDGQHLPVL